MARLSGACCHTAWTNRERGEEGGEGGGERGEGGGGRGEGGGGRGEGGGGRGEGLWFRCDITQYSQCPGL